MTLKIISGVAKSQDVNDNNAYLEDIVRKANAGPKGIYSTFVNLEYAHPAGDNHIYLVTEDGYWYYWNEIAWIKGAMYQAIEFGVDSVTAEMLAPKAIEKKALNDNLLAEYNNLLIQNAFIEDNTKYILNNVRATMTVKPNSGFTSTIQGWSTRVSYDGVAFDIIRARIRVEFDTIVRCSVRNDENEVITSKDLFIVAETDEVDERWYDFPLTELIDDTKILTPNFYISVMPIETDARISGFSYIISDGTDMLTADVNHPNYYIIDGSSTPVSTSTNYCLDLETGLIINRILVVDSDIDEFIENITELQKTKLKSSSSIEIEKNLDGTFEAIAHLVENFANHKRGNESFEYLTSTFSGWGRSIGNIQNFNTITFKFRNRVTNNNPVTSIRMVIRKHNRYGEILYDQIINGLNIIPGEEKEMIISVGMIENLNNDDLYAYFQCNQLIDTWFSVMDPIINLNEPEYGVTMYTTGGSLTESSTSDLYDPDLNNNRGPVIIAGIMDKKYTPKQGFFEGVVVESSEKPVRIILPNKITCVVGDKFQLFYRGIVEAINPYDFDIRVNYSGGSANRYQRYLQIQPLAEDIGTHELTITIQNRKEDVIATASTSIEVVAEPISPIIKKNILCIGDSLTSAGYWVREAARRFNAIGGIPEGHNLSNVEFIGTVENKSEGVGWEGYGGWTWASYMSEPTATNLDMWVYCTHDKDITDQHSRWFDGSGNIWTLETIEDNKLKFTRYLDHIGEMPTGVGVLVHNALATHIIDINFASTVAAGGNPFWNEVASKVDFADYCNRNGYSGIDYVVSLLTWNGLAAYRSEAVDHASHVNYAKALINKLHEAYPNAKVMIMGIQLPSLNGGMGANYGAGAGSYAEVYGNIRTVFGMNLAYQELANDPLYNSYVEFVNVSGQFDSENNMPEAEVPVNSRSIKTEKRGTNGVHPHADGYMQIGDVAYRVLSAKFN